MKYAAIAAAIVLAACSSTSQGPMAKIAAPDFDIEQTFGPSELGYPEAPVDVKYTIRVANHSSIPMTLTKVTLHTVNPPGGAYTLTPPLVHTMKVEVPPNGEKTFDLWAHAQSYGVSMRDREPVTIKGFAYFDTPQGYYNLNINQELQQ